MGNNPGFPLLICNSAWPHIVYWKVNTGAAIALGESPGSVFTMCNFQGCVVAAIAGTNTIRWSDPGTIETWPADSELTVDLNYGLITNLVGLDDKILIFCEKGILYLNGDIMDQPHVGVLHPEIGAMRDTAEQYGSSVAFMFAQNLYTLDGSINLASDAIRDTIEVPPGSHVAMNAEYVYVYPCNYFTTTQTLPPPGGGVDVYVMEKTRQGFWSKYTFPNDTAVGHLHTGGAVSLNALVKYISYPWDCFAFAGTDGNLIVQPVPGKYPNVLVDTDINYTGAINLPVVTKIETRPLDFGDRILTKQFRRGIIYGVGSNIVVKMYLTHQDKTTTEITPTLSSTDLPCQFTLPVQDGTETSAPLEFNEMSFYLGGDNLEVQNIELEFKPIRYNLLTFE